MELKSPEETIPKADQSHVNILAYFPFIFNQSRTALKMKISEILFHAVLSAMKNTAKPHVKRKKKKKKKKRKERKQWKNRQSRRISVSLIHFMRVCAFILAFEILSLQFTVHAVSVKLQIFSAYQWNIESTPRRAVTPLFREERICLAFRCPR